MITSRWEWSRFCLNMALTKRPPLKICTIRLTYSAMTGPKPRIFWNYHNLKENIAAALVDLLTMNLLPHPRQHLTIWMNYQITPLSLRVQKDFQCTGKALTKQEEPKWLSGSQIRKNRCRLGLSLVLPADLNSAGSL